MNQERIGKFICSQRKSKNLTQQALANMLGISDRAVSKWERGINLPDASLMIELSNILGITVTELLSGEIIKENNIMKASEDKIIELSKINEDYAKKLLRVEIFIGINAVIILLSTILCITYFSMNNTLKYIILILGLIIFLISIIYCLWIETKAGYYECKHCKYKYIPSYKTVLFAMHINRTRYMKCPKCNKYYWQKKVTK